MERDDIHELSAAYALDALDPADGRAYEEHLGRCPECREEVASLRATASRLAYVPEGPAPPPALRERILAQAREERGKVVPLAARRSPVWPTRALAAAAAVAAVALGAWSLSLSQSLEHEREAVELLTDPTAQSVPLEGAVGRLVVGDEGAVLVVAGLGPAPSGKTYEVWVIDGTRPRPAGLFEGGDEREIVRLTRPVPKGAQVAVTLERDGGVDAPTSEPLFAAKT